ncbi:pyridoxine 5'-phosphate synthase [bacterium]|nr:pyridoxine 5'-phosphate synthase [bacterium]
MPSLGVNIDHVATLRQARRVCYPDILQAAQASIRGGADQITIHLREDRRHIQDEDLYRIKDKISIPINLEMATVEEIVDIALRVKPNTITLVPEKREEITTEGGLDVIKNFDILNRYISSFKANSISVSLFIDPEIDQLKASKDLGADVIELHTGEYCNAVEGDLIQKEMNRLREAAQYAKKAGFRVCAGHGLHYENTAQLVKFVPEIVEYNIGHSIIARAIFVGLEEAVREMVKLVGSV